jgi:hypothetical protein
MIRTIILLATSVVLIGCESNFDKCFDAEQAKAERFREAVIENHPVLGLAVKL